MSAMKKGRRVSIIIGLVFVLVSVLLIVVTVKTEHYTATITEITNSYTTHKTGKKHRTYYFENVTVTYVNGDGKQSEATDIRVKRTSETQLPEIGQTIEVTDNILGVKEYRTMTQLTVGGTLIVVGLLIIIVSLRVGRKKKEVIPDAPQTGEEPG